MFHAYGKMSPLSLLLIFGTCITFSVVVFCSPSPEYVPGSDFKNCQELTEEHGYTLKYCLLRLNAPEEMNKTKRIYNNPRFAQCKHTCRLRDEFSNCLTNGLEALQNVSTKSKYMVPFLRTMLDTVMTSLCENDGEIMIVTEEEDAQCILRAWNECKTKFDFLDDLDRVAFCDSANPNSDPFTIEYVCKEVTDFFECAARETDSCSEVVKSSLAHLKSKTSAWESCAEYI